MGDPRGFLKVKRKKPSERPLREHGFYETYFTVLQQVLAEQKAAPAGAKN